MHLFLKDELLSVLGKRFLVASSITSQLERAV